MVRVATAEKAQLDGPAAHLGRRRRGERPVWWVDDDLVQQAGELRRVRLDGRLPRLSSPLHEPDTALMAPDRRRPEQRIAEGVVEVPVGVDDDRDRVGGQRAQVGEDLARLAIGRARVDDQRLASTQDHADVLVVELVAAHEDAVRDLDPAIGDAHRPMISTRTPADRPMLGSPDNRTPPPGSASER